jgi:hypothetical protein
MYINETIQKNTVQTVQNTVNTGTHITETPARYKTHTYRFNAVSVAVANHLAVSPFRDC